MLSLRSDSLVANGVHKRLLQFLSPLWDQQIILSADPELRPFKVMIQLKVTESVPKPRGLFLFRTRVAQVWFRWRAREILHVGTVFIVLKEDRGRRSIRIEAPTPDDLFESGWAALLSVIGEDGDQVGFHRVHALGFQRDTGSVIVFADGGVGKSTLGQMILARTELAIAGDEIPLVAADGMVHCCPLPMALRRRHGQMDLAFPRKIFGTKTLLPLPKERWAQPMPIQEVIWMRKGSVASLAPASSWRIAGPLFLHLVIGKGVPQMAEFFLRGRGLLALVRIFFGRLKTWIQILRHSGCWILNLSSDPEDAWRLISEKILRAQRVSAVDFQDLNVASKRSSEFKSDFASPGSFGEMT
jgi:hypothetical protein